MTKFKGLALSLLICLPLTTNAQFFVMTDGQVETCGGTFVDAGNTADGVGNPYPDQNLTFTICPDNPDDAVSLNFLAFGLQTNLNPNNSDYLYIFDGTDTNAPSMGSYTGGALQGLPVTATVNNPTGCLTFFFQDNGPPNELSPGWEAEIICTTPCDAPVAASSIVDPPLPNPDSISVGVCLNEPVTFGDAGSTAGTDFNLSQWIWNFDDGTSDTLNSPADVTHSFEEPGEYIVNLTVLDDNGCASLNAQPLQVLVSTIPVFNAFQSTPVCAGSPAFVDGNPVQSVTWTALPPQVVAGETYLADGAGFSYSDTLFFNFFDDGATLEDCDDFLSVTVNMEHSYLGDLDISVSCPDGTTVSLMSYPNGGGGTYLGEAVDDGSTTPGLGYDYGWSPNAEIATNINDGENWSNGSVNPGIYTPEGDLCDFEGCPLNGAWVFSVIDNLAIDNGYIFEWGINLAPELFPGVTTFTPVIGLNADSSYWTGPSIINQDFDANYCDIILDTPGNYEYDFTVLNNFGCAFDTTVVIDVIQGPESSITGGADQIFCGGVTELQGEVLNSDFPGVLNWSWEPAENLSDADTPTPIVNDFNGQPTMYVAYVDPEGYDYCSTTDTVYVIPGFNYQTDFDMPSCLLNDGFISVDIDEPPSEGPWTLTLSEGGTLTESIESMGGLDVFSGLEPGNYLVALSDPVGCAYEVAYTLTPPPPMDFDITPDPTICINGYAVLEVSSDMDPTGEWTYTWDNGLGTGDMQTVNPVQDTDYEVFATDENGCLSEPQTVTVQVYDSLSVGLDAPELICGGAFAELEATGFSGGSGAGYAFNWTWENAATGSNDPYWVDYPAATGTYCVTLTDNCESPAVTSCETVTIETPIPAAFSSDTTKACVPGVFQFESLVDPALISQTEWFFGDGELSYEANPAHAYLSPGGYDITFNITSLIGCEYTNFQPNYLQVYTPPYVGFTASPQPTRVPDTEIQFEAVNSSNVVDWYWLFDSINGLGTSDMPHPDFTFPIDVGGDYPVTLVVMDENGCSSQITRIIEIQDMFVLYIPTAFTPNNDGVNDAFFVQGADLDPNRFEMRIVNRWGNLVFETNDINEVWYGPANEDSEHFAQDGLYYYSVVVYSLSNPAERKEITGSVLVTR